MSVNQCASVVSLSLYYQPVWLLCLNRISVPEWTENTVLINVVFSDAELVGDTVKERDNTGI